MCSIEGCEGSVTSRGWCERHYTRWKRHGDPLVTMKRWRSSTDPVRETKACTKCNEEKPLSAFSKSNKSGDGRKERCRSCVNAIERSKRDPQKELERARRWRVANPEKARMRVKRWRDDNRLRFNATSQAWRKSRPEEMRAQSTRAYLKSRQCPKYRVNAAIKARLHAGITGKAKSGQRTFDLLGYAVSDLVAHIEQQFTPGMSWGNYGKYGWHIDHIRPLASFHYSTFECIEFKQAWALANLQPLWADENWRKHAKMPQGFCASALSKAHPGTFAILWHENHTGVFKSAADGVDRLMAAR